MATPSALVAIMVRTVLLRAAHCNLKPHDLRLTGVCPGLAVWVHGILCQRCCGQRKQRRQIGAPTTSALQKTWPCLLSREEATETLSTKLTARSKSEKLPPATCLFGADCGEQPEKLHCGGVVFSILPSRSHRTTAPWALPNLQATAASPASE